MGLDIGKVQPFPGITERPACYTKKSLEEFRYNPMIEALPAPLTREQTIASLIIRPPYCEEDRSRPYEERLDLTQRIINSHMPTTRDIDICMRIGKCIRWGYENRNPLDASYTSGIQKRYHSMATGDRNYFGGYHPNTQGFAVIGVSGIGKTTTIEAILRLYPQVICHTSYEGIPLQMKQVVWIKLECPGDGSLKSLCLNFFRELDRLVGTDHLAQNQRSRCTLDRMQIRMSQLCATYNVGLLVIDEIQALRAAKGSSEAALNFFISLVNTVGVPVVMVGTPKALTILQDEFQQAKRGSGQGDVLWDRMRQDKSWETYVKSIWTYQYTKEPVPLAKDIEDALYYEAQGIPFIASHLYKLVQEDAILSGKEVFDASDFHRVASKKMGLTKPLRDAIRNNQDIDLKALETATRWEPAPVVPDNAPREEAAPKVPVRTSVLREATIFLTRLDIPYAEAEECVILAMDGFKEPAPVPMVAYRAIALHMEHEKSKNGHSEKAGIMTGYDALSQEGMIASEVL